MPGELGRSGRLVAVGLGPGDPELITVRGLRCLQAADIIVAPRAAGTATSQAERIAAPWLDLSRQQILPLAFPLDMRPDALDDAWAAAAEELAAPLLAGRELVYLVVGDPLLFGSFLYLWEKLAECHPQIPVEVIPGVTSASAGAAAAGLPLALGKERLALLPATYEGDEGRLRQLFEAFDTVVLLKAGRTLPRLLPFLEKEGLVPHATVVEYATRPNQRCFQDVREAAGQKLSYWSLLIVRRPRADR